MTGLQLFTVIDVAALIAGLAVYLFIVSKQLKGVAGEVRDKIFRNMSERAAANLSEEIELLGPMRLATVEEAQNAVVRVIRALEESGQIMISRGDDEFVV